jgi:dTDP-4-amino-4,6-dideoxygalactose transaminase
MIAVTKPDLPPLGEYTEFLKKIWASRWLTNNGEFLLQFEERLRQYLNIKNIVVVSNGTLALHLALKSLPKKGEIITTPFTFITTTNVILWEGFTPVFADIDLETFNINPDDVERKITEKTVAILAVHVYGNPCDVKRLEEIAEKHKITLIFDAAHAFGVEYEHQSVLNFGHISTLSFHATKQFNSIEGGGIVTLDETLVSKFKLLRDHGIKSEEEVELPGTNAKMNEFQAALGICNLNHLEEKLALRQQLYQYYKDKLSSLPLQFQKIVASKYNYSYFPVCFTTFEQRERVFEELLKKGIRTRKYFYPLTTSAKYLKQMNLVEKYHLQNAHNITNRVLCLPLYPDLEKQNIDYIAEIITECV